MRQRSRVLAAAFVTFLGLTAAHAATFVSTLSGAAEVPSAVTAGTGSTTITFDPGAHTLRVVSGFSGLTGLTTASHIHCCVAPGSNAGVATTTPSFVGFPLGVTSGSMDQTYNTLSAATYNPAFVNASGGTIAQAEAALFSGMLGGQTYLNVHTTTFPGGEIRGLLLAAPSGLLIPTLSQSVLGILALLLAAVGFVVLRRRRA